MPPAVGRRCPTKPRVNVPLPAGPPRCRASRVPSGHRPQRHGPLAVHRRSPDTEYRRLQGRGHCVHGGDPACLGQRASQGEK